MRFAFDAFCVLLVLFHIVHARTYFSSVLLNFTLWSPFKPRASKPTWAPLIMNIHTSFPMQTRSCWVNESKPVACHWGRSLYGPPNSRHGLCVQRSRQVLWYLLGQSYASFVQEFPVQELLPWWSGNGHGQFDAATPCTAYEALASINLHAYMVRDRQTISYQG